MDAQWNKARGLNTDALNKILGKNNQTNSTKVQQIKKSKIIKEYTAMQTNNKNDEQALR